MEPPAQNAVVLVVEDEALIRFLAATILEEAGFTVYEAENAADAVRLLAERPDINALFTDVEMPGAMNGLELARHARARFRQLGIVVTSGRHNIGADSLPGEALFVAKPYRLDHVVDTLRRLAS